LNGSDAYYTAGKIGIGTTNPGVPLDARGDPGTSAGFNVVGRFIRSAGGNNGVDFGYVGNESYSAVSPHTTSADFAILTGASFSDRFHVTTGGNIGIGTTGPRGALDVQGGTILGKQAVSNASSTIDFSTGNIQYTASNCGAFQLNNMKDGGSYTFIVKGATAATCTFTAYSDAGTTSLTVHMPPDNGNTTASKHTIFSLLVGGTDVYVAWTPGY
jgi:hypothetical protein